MKKLVCKLCGKPRKLGQLKCKDCQVKQYNKHQRELIRKEKKKEKKANSIPKLKKQADILFSQAVRLRDKKCLKTGSKENLQCSHIWGRSNLAIRWDMDNALTLTAGKHLYWWHKEPAEAVIWAKEILGDKKWGELKIKKNAYFKLTPEFLKNKIDELKNLIIYYENLVV